MGGEEEGEGKLGSACLSPSLTARHALSLSLSLSVSPSPVSVVGLCCVPCMPSACLPALPACPIHALLLMCLLPFCGSIVGRTFFPAAHMRQGLVRDTFHPVYSLSLVRTLQCLLLSFGLLTQSPSCFCGLWLAFGGFLYTFYHLLLATLSSLPIVAETGTGVAWVGTFIVAVSLPTYLCGCCLRPQSISPSFSYLPGIYYYI